MACGGHSGGPEPAIWQRTRSRRTRGGRVPVRRRLDRGADVRGTEERRGTSCHKDGRGRADRARPRRRGRRSSSGGRPRGGGPCRRPGADPAGGGDPRAFRSVEGDEPARPSSTSPDTTRQTSYQRPRGSTSSVYSAQPRVPRSTRPSFREEGAVVSTTYGRRRTCSSLRDFPRYARSRAR